MSEWIAVSERLPEHNQRVLVTYADPEYPQHVQTQCAVFKDYGTRYIFSEGKDVHEFTFSLDAELLEGGYLSLDITPSAATHWMPLPEPPQ